MKTDVRESSIDCYHECVVPLLESGQAEQVARYVKRFGKCSRREVARGMKMETGTVSARVNKLIADGVLVEGDEADRIKCPVTGKLVYWINHRDNMPAQISMI